MKRLNTRNRDGSCCVEGCHRHFDIFKHDGYRKFVYGILCRVHAKEYDAHLEKVNNWFMREAFDWDGRPDFGRAKPFAAPCPEWMPSE